MKYLGMALMCGVNSVTIGFVGAALDVSPFICVLLSLPWSIGLICIVEEARYGSNNS